MKIDFRVNIKAETQAHYTTFPQTEQGARLLQRNRTNLLNGADQAGKQIAASATAKVKAHGPASRVDVIM